MLIAGLYRQHWFFWRVLSPREVNRPHQWRSIKPTDGSICDDPSANRPVECRCEHHLSIAAMFPRQIPLTIMTARVPQPICGALCTGLHRYTCLRTESLATRSPLWMIFFWRNIVTKHDANFISTSLLDLPTCSSGLLNARR